MILSKIILAATVSATALWFMPMHGSGSVHEHSGAVCGHLDVGHAAPTAGPDAHADHSHSAVYAATKCDGCNGKGKVDCWECQGRGKWKETCRTCNGKQVVIVPGKFTAQGCKRCGGTGKEKFECSSCKGKGKVTCSKCNGKGKI